MVLESKLQSDDQRKVTSMVNVAVRCLLLVVYRIGKSLTSEDAPYVFDFVQHGERQEMLCVCLIVLPLVALMHEGSTCFKNLLKEYRALRIQSEQIVAANN